MAFDDELPESLVRDNIVRSVGEVFEGMLRRPAAPQDWAGAWPPRPRAEPGAPTPQVVVTVGFFGDAKGRIHLHFESALAVDCTGSMLGMAASELSGAGDAVVNYAIGELTRLIVVSFRNGLDAAGILCGLTDLSFLRGLSPRMDPSGGTQRYVYAFDCGGRRLVAEILVAGDRTSGCVVSQSA
ncbi:MAG: chemotaxis protein CheX [Opitutaceae bacterium]|jgi:hypothetical protein